MNLKALKERLPKLTIDGDKSYELYCAAGSITKFRELIADKPHPKMWAIELPVKNAEELGASERIFSYRGGGLRVDYVLGHKDHLGGHRLAMRVLREGVGEHELVFTPNPAGAWYETLNEESIIAAVADNWSDGPLEGFLAANELEELIELHNPAASSIASAATRPLSYTTTRANQELAALHEAYGRIQDLYSLRERLLLREKLANTSDDLGLSFLLAILWPAMFIAFSSVAAFLCLLPFGRDFALAILFFGLLMAVATLLIGVMSFCTFRGFELAGRAITAILKFRLKS